MSKTIAGGSPVARIAEVPVRHRPRERRESKYGLSRTWRVTVDMLTVGTIRWFRERPLALFCRVAVVAGAVGTIFIAATIVAVVYFWPYKAHSLVFPGVATTSFGLSFYLLMLGLIGETVLYGNRQTTNRPGEPPAVGGTS